MGCRNDGGALCDMNDGEGARAAASAAAAAGGTARRNLAAGSHREESQRPRGCVDELGDDPMEAQPTT